MRYVSLVMLFCGGVILAQAPAPVSGPAPAFEVASVKLNTSGSTSASTSGRAGTFTAINTRLLALIARAYRLREFQVTGPDWINAERFDINARAPEGATSADNAIMLRTLLVERFKLMAHTEMREQPIYALVVARSDGRLGPRIKPSTLDCPSQPASSRCGLDSNVGDAVGKLTGTGQTPQNIAAALGNVGLSRLVVDRTGLMGGFDFELQWTADTGRPAAGTSPSDAPSIFTALQEQLGLKLEAQRGPVEFLVIDSIGRPTPD